MRSFSGALGIVLVCASSISPAAAQTPTATPSASASASPAQAGPSAATASAPTPGAPGAEESAAPAVPSVAPSPATSDAPLRTDTPRSDELEPPTPEALEPKPAHSAESQAPESQSPESPAGVNPSQPVALNPGAVGTPRPPAPVRKLQRLSILGEWGWNSLVGMGPELAFHVHPNVTLEGGAGLSFAGWKLGARGRVNLLQRDLTPFIGVGVMHTSGIDLLEISDSQDPTNVTSVVSVRPAESMQAVVGLDWIDRNSFNLVTSVGYAWLLGGSNVEVLSGQLDPNEGRAMDVVFGGGVVISLAMGYSLR